MNITTLSHPCLQPNLLAAAAPACCGIIQHASSTPHRTEPRIHPHPTPEQNWSDGWRLSLGLAAAPALILTLGGIILPDSPNSLVERGKKEEGRRVLEKIRGTKDVDAGEHRRWGLAGRCVVAWRGR